MNSYTVKKTATSMRNPIIRVVAQRGQNRQQVEAVTSIKTRSGRRSLSSCVTSSVQVGLSPQLSLNNSWHGSNGCRSNKWAIDAKLVRFFSSDKENDASKLHESFQEQLLELEQERIELFGSDESPIDIDDPINSTIQHQPKKDRNIYAETGLTREEFNQDRDETYNFSKEEKNAWATTAKGGSHSYNEAFLTAVKKAQEAKATYEASLKLEVDEHVEAIAKEANDDLRSTHVADSHETNNTGNQNTKEEIPVSEFSNKGVVNEYFTHLNEKGDEVSMVDVGGKKITRRTAVARSSVYLPPEVMDAFGVIDGQNEMVGKKGPIFSTARLAGIMGAKRTSELIPLCHPLPIDRVHIQISLQGNRAVIECECCVTHKTGVEMEALTGASVAALTIYDMVKAVSHRVRIESTELISKTGGKRDVVTNSSIE